MRSGSLRTCLLRLMVLIPLASMVTNAGTVANGEGHPHHNHPRSRISFSSAVNMAKKFVCKEPQLRAYHLKDLMQPIVQSFGDTASQPIYIVLKRCDGQSGCCSNPDLICSPVQVHYEDIEIELWSLQANKTRRQWVRVEQHDRCSCEINALHSRHQLDHKQLKVFLI
ncbi:uncharacterized protein LOC143377554 [Andrena cerasifolii]|uniref:uncharacterized protein LOC143377554 n=1 Tax=Andrena cerasifolii TaxID=2819439 RepID=UPI004037E778